VAFNIQDGAKNSYCVGIFRHETGGRGLVEFPSRPKPKTATAVPSSAFIRIISCCDLPPKRRLPDAIAFIIDRFATERPRAPAACRPTDNPRLGTRHQPAADGEFDPAAEERTDDGRREWLGGGRRLSGGGGGSNSSYVMTISVSERRLVRLLL